MNKIYIRIDGITCNNCRNKITNNLLNINNIKKVNIVNNIATIEYVHKLDKCLLIKTINDLGYFTEDKYINEDINLINNRISFKDIIFYTLIILIIYLIIYKILGFNIFNVIPNIDSSITYGMLFITGILTSIHCISMCGAINLAVSTGRSIKNPLLYNLGRVVSYTIIGGIVGLIGSVLSVNYIINGIIILFSSLIMFLYSLNMMGLINNKFIIKYKKKSYKFNKPFLIGLLNGFMPCGPLQAMQAYALSTASLIKGALAMFIFSIGTVPLMLFIGIFNNLFKGKKRIIINKISCILILLLSIIMFSRGISTLGFNINSVMDNSYTASIIYEDYQLIEFDLDYNNYEDIIVQKGIKVRMIIHVDKKYLTGCNNEIIIKEYNIDQKLYEGDNIIEFMPNEEGTYSLNCWMNMINNNIKVIDNYNYFKEGN
jgi:sulfite exporter TauE/SafE/copper chaperone CopZ